ncbi:hypothetical protein ACWDRB_31865 [Nonomuraea sp. NPDC003707]
MDALAQVKHAPGTDIAILGSPTLTGTLLPANLMVNPIILGVLPYYRPQG